MTAPPENRTASVEASATSVSNEELGAVFVYGRLSKLRRAAVSDSLVNRNARLVGDPGEAHTVVVGHRALDACIGPDTHLHLPFVPAARARLLSEGAFMRHLAGSDDNVRGAGRSPYGIDDVARLSGLHVFTCAALSLFDVIGGGEGRFAYADLATARQVAALVRQGAGLVAVVRAAWRLATRGLAVGQVRLAAAPWGTEIVQRLGPQVARLDGQFVLVLDEGGQRRDDALALALACEQGGDLSDAERWYSLAAQADRADPVPCYNRGNVLAVLGRTAEAMIAFQQALGRDPDFAEAAFNLAVLVEQTDAARAIALYRDAIASHPAYAQAVYNLARLLTVAEDYTGALPLWERFMALAPTDPDVVHARRAVVLCRFERRRRDALSLARALNETP